MAHPEDLLYLKDQQIEKLSAENARLLRLLGGGDKVMANQTEEISKLRALIKKAWMSEDLNWLREEMENDDGK